MASETLGNTDDKKGTRERANKEFLFVQNEFETGLFLLFICYDDILRSIPFLTL